MQIKKLCVNNHLCLVDFEINFNTINGGSSTILIGENGTGKTTMLETILEILMSFDSPSIEKNIDYDYLIEYEYAQSPYFIQKVGHDYRVDKDNNLHLEGSYRKIRKFIKTERIFPQRIITFYSGSNNKIKPHITQINNQYTKLCRQTLNLFFKVMSDDSERLLPNFPKRKYNYCDEDLTSIYLSAILCGHDSFEKQYFIETCEFDKVEFIDMAINIEKVERILGRGSFEGDIPTGLYYLTDFIDHRFTDFLRRGFMYSTGGKSYFEIQNLNELNVDAITIMEFFEKLHSLFDAQYEVTVSQGASLVKCSQMSEGQRQLIKILGMLGVCKTEDCLVLMDEPDAHMNPKWKYEIKETIDRSLEKAVNTQALIATHDPLVINGVSKEFIRIFTHNESVRQNNGFYIAQVIEPIEDTTGMGIDGLLQSQYYRLSTSYDKPTFDKFKERQQLYIKLINNEISPEEKERLKQITKELGALPKSYTTIDFLYDDFIKVYRNSPLYHKEYLSFDELDRRRAEIEEIINALYEAQI